MSFRPSRSRDAQAFAARRRLAALADGLARPLTSGDPEVAVPPAEPETSGGVSRARQPGRHVDRSAVREWRLPRLSSQHVAVIAVAVSIVCVLAGWQVLRSVPDSQPVELSSTRMVPTQPLADSATPTAGAPSASPPTDGAPADSSPDGVLVVDVTGKVRRPGIVELPAGSRVVDAVEAAGGARPAADTSTLNLARLLIDGEQIVVGVALSGAGLMEVPSTPSGADASIIPVDLNAATAEQLETLPGVGPVTAAAILEWRTQHGAFSSVDELLEVSGIGEATLGELKPYVHV